MLKEWFESNEEGEEEGTTITIDIQARMNANFGAGDVASSSRLLSREDMPKEIREGDNATTVAYEDAGVRDREEIVWDSNFEDKDEW